MKGEKVTNKAAYSIAELYKLGMEQCDKCGNNVLYNDTEDIPIISCPICGMRYYPSSSIIKRLATMLKVKYEPRGKY
jgi:hypothetical protein